MPNTPPRIYLLDTPPTENDGDDNNNNPTPRSMLMKASKSGARATFIMMGLFAMVGLTQYGSVLKPYKNEIRVTLASHGSEPLYGNLQQQQQKVASDVVTKEGETTTSWQPPPPPIPPPERNTSSSRILLNSTSTSAVGAATAPPAAAATAETAANNQNNSNDTSTTSPQSPPPTTATTDIVSSDSQQQQQQQQQEPQPRNQFYLMNCHQKEWGFFVRTELFHIFGDLIEKYGWREISADEVAKLPDAQVPKVILYCENNVRFNSDKYNTIQSYRAMKVERLRKLGTRIAIYNDDTHVFNSYSTDEMKYILSNTDAILSTYAYLLKQWFEGPVFASTKMPAHVWIPHSASPSYTNLEFNENPIRKIFWSGAEDPTLYPMRAYLKKRYIQLRKHPGWTFKGHPGYAKHSHNQTASYAQRIHQNFCGLSTTMAIRRLVAKSFEVPATGALLLINLDLEEYLKVLGLHNKQHYVGFPNHLPDPTVMWVLDPQNKDEIDTIRRRGMEVIHALHTTQHRARQIHDYFEKGVEPFPHHEALKLVKPSPCPMVGTFSEQGCKATQRKIFYWHHFKPKAVTVPPFNTSRR